MGMSVIILFIHVEFLIWVSHETLYIMHEYGYELTSHPQAHTVQYIALGTPSLSFNHLSFYCQYGD